VPSCQSKRLPQVLSLPGSHQQSRPQSRKLDQDLRSGFVGEDGAAFAHGDVVRGIEADGGDVAEGADLLAAPGAAEGVAAVFDEPQVVLFAEGGDGVEIEDVAQGVGDHDGLGPRAVALLQAA
jgi:hypothetical protein